MCIYRNINDCSFSLKKKKTKMKWPPKYRFDLVVSYWIFAWFLLHMAGWIQASPKLALIVGLLANVAIFVIMLIYANPNATIFAPIQIVIKAIPLWFVWRERIRWREDGTNLAILLALFVAWNWAVGENIAENAEIFAESWKTGETPAKSYPGTALIKNLAQ